MGPQNQGFWPKINCSQMKLPNFVSSSGDGSSKIGHDFSNKVKLSINHFNKNCAHKQFFFNEKKIRKIRLIFDIDMTLKARIVLYLTFHSKSIQIPGKVLWPFS